MAPQSTAIKLTQAEKDYQLARPNEVWTDGLTAYRIAFLCVAEICVILRMVGRRVQKITLRADDYTLMVAGVLALGHGICGILSVKYGYGHHTLDVPKATYPQRQKAGYAANIIWAIGFSLSRISLTLLYKRVFIPKWFQHVCNFVICVFIAFATSIALVDAFSVLPVSANWTPGAKPTTSVDFDKVQYSATSVPIITDVILLILPLFIIWRLKMTLLGKLGISFMFCLGFLSTLATGIRLHYAIANKKSRDPGWTGKNGSYWTITELYLAILCPAIITFPPVILMYYRRFLSKLSPAAQARVSRITRVDPNTPSSFGGAVTEPKRSPSDEDSSGSEKYNHLHGVESSLNSKPSDIEAQTAQTGPRDANGMALDQNQAVKSLDPRLGGGADHKEGGGVMGNRVDAGEGSRSHSEQDEGAIAVSKGYKVESEK